MSDLVIALRRMAEEYTTGRIRSYSALSLNHQVAAAGKAGFTQPNICKCLNGERATSDGCKWEWA